MGAWEYAAIKSDVAHGHWLADLPQNESAEATTMLELLNELGALGWELTEMQTKGGGYILRRPVAAPGQF